MPREVQVFSMSFLDLLCCALGGVILLSLIMILNARQDASQTIEHTYVIANATLWIEITDPILEASNKTEVEELLTNGELDYDQIALIPWEKRIEQYRPQLWMKFESLPDALARVKPAEADKLKTRIGDESDDELKAQTGGPAGVYEKHLSGICDDENFFSYRSPLDVSRIILSGDKLYYRFDLSSWGQRVRSGYYYFRLVMTSSPDSDRDNPANVIAVIDVSGSGVSRRVVAQTAASLPEPVFAATDPDPKAATKLAQAFDKHSAEKVRAGKETDKSRRKLHKSLRNLQPAIRFTPEQQITSPKGLNSGGDSTCYCKYVRNDKERSPFLAIVSEHTGARSLQRFPQELDNRNIRYRKFATPGGGNFDYYLPGVCVTARR